MNSSSDLCVSAPLRETFSRGFDQTRCLLVIDEPAAGVWNMAVDEALLERASQTGEASLRFYQWREPTLSLGYSQRYADCALHPAGRTAQVVRRLSGGGALLHDRELTYSLCLPPGCPAAARPGELYQAVHQSLIEMLADLGVAGRLLGEVFPPPPVSPPPGEPFLCFARRGGNDVVHALPAGSHGVTKIVGSAQRRARGAVLQHGAILLEHSALAPELLGVNDVAPVRLEPDQLIAPWRTRLADRLGLQLLPCGDGGRDWAERSHGLSEKYASPSWTERR